MVGVTLNVGLYGVYLCFAEWGLSPLFSSTLVFFMGIPLSLIAHRRLTFRSSKVDFKRKLLFGVGYFIGYIVQIALLMGLYRGLDIPHQIAQFCAIVGVALALFIYQRHVIFDQ